MKVIGISSSARKAGNIAILINKAFEELQSEGIETELIQLMIRQRQQDEVNYYNEE